VCVFSVFSCCYLFDWFMLCCVTGHDRFFITRSSFCTKSQGYRAGMLPWICFIVCCINKLHCAWDRIVVINSFFILCGKTCFIYWILLYFVICDLFYSRHFAVLCVVWLDLFIEFCCIVWCIDMLHCAWDIFLFFVLANWFFCVCLCMFLMRNSDKQGFWSGDMRVQIPWISSFRASTWIMHGTYSRLNT
jgi:hypothetical protein